MEHVFIELLNMSITASWLVLAIILFRLLFKKAPKALHVGLWALVGIRLICPFSIESVLSLVPSTETIPQDIVYSDAPTIESGIPALNSTVNPIISETLKPEVGASVNPVQIWLFAASNIWVIGIIVMFLYTAISYWRIHRKVRESVRIQENIWMCDRIDTPFILGVFRPHIYLPSNMCEQDIKFVLAHEQAHIKRHDHWWKPLGFALLSIYWFHPILWIAYILLCRDIELACDEKVIKEMGIEIKKPAFWIVLIAVIACVIVAVCFLTNPKDKQDKEAGDRVTVSSSIFAGVHLPETILSQDDAKTIINILDSRAWEEDTNPEMGTFIIVINEKHYEYEPAEGILYNHAQKECLVLSKEDKATVGEIIDKYLFADTTKSNITNVLKSGTYLAGTNYVPPTSSSIGLYPYFYLNTDRKEFHMGKSPIMSFALFGKYEFDGTKLTLSVDISDNTDKYVFFLNQYGSFVYDENASTVTSEYGWFKDGMVFGLIPEGEEY